MFKQCDVQAYIRPGCELLIKLLVRLKDKILKEQVMGLVYHIPCDSCDAFYIVKTERS